MRPHFFISLLCLVLGCFPVKNDEHSHVLDGKWTPVKQEIGGRQLPAAVFQLQELIINDSTYEMRAESVDKGVLMYKNGKMDIYGREGVNMGKHFTAICELDDDRLTICYNLQGDYYPAAFETASAPMHFLSVFQRIHGN
jgi:uncharacterized protein (TIGR03067 family)